MINCCACVELLPCPNKWYLNNWFFINWHRSPMIFNNGSLTFPRFSNSLFQETLVTDKCYLNVRNGPANTTGIYGTYIPSYFAFQCFITLCHWILVGPKYPEIEILKAVSIFKIPSTQIFTSVLKKRPCLLSPMHMVAHHQTNIHKPNLSTSSQVKFPSPLTITIAK